MRKALPIPRRRTNDPSNVPPEPRLASSRERAAEISEELKRRLAYLWKSYSTWREFFEKDHAFFNDSLKRLRRRVRTPHVERGRGERVHPEIEAVISHHARRLAAEEGCEVAQRHANEAARIAVKLLKIRRGRPGNRGLDHHVRGLMALIIETTGKPVLAQRDRKSVYDPGFAPGGSELIPIFFRKIDPGVTETRLGKAVREARKAFAGKPMRFLDLFPFYDATLADGVPQPHPPFKLERFEPNIPIYCP